MHYYQFNIGDYHSHTGHLDYIEDIAYRRMIDWYYLHESPLPDSTEDIARLIRMRDQITCIDSLLSEYFTLEEDGFHNARIDSEIKSYQNISKSRKKAANKRWANKHKGLRDDASALQTTCTSNAKQEPGTKNQEPRTNSIKTLDQNEFDHLFELFWQSGIRKVNKKKSRPLFNKVLKSQESPAMFTDKLISDVTRRLNSSQLGFAEMHPTTYLNGERWHDEVTHETHQRPNQPKPSLVDRIKANTTARREERERRKSCGQPMGENGSDVRTQVCEPIRGDAGRDLDNVLDGDFRETDG